MTVKLPTKISLGHTDINIKLIESGVALDIGEQQGSYSYRTNTIYLDEEEKIIGENTDVYGLQAAYIKEIIESKAVKKKVLINPQYHYLIQ